MSDKVLPEALIEELLPCPFCGNEHPFLEGPTYARHVTCNNHECQASILSDATDAEAIISWNTRASPSSRVLQDEGVVAWAFCPECGSEEIRYEEGRHKQCANCGQEWFSDIDYTDVCAKNLRRLFAAPPAILPSTIGCSVGVSEDAGLFWRWASDNKWRMLGTLSDDALANFVRDQEKIAPVVISRLFALPTKDPDNANS
jgi:hypothetical protein